MLPLALGKDEELADKPTYFGRYRIVRELGKGGMARVFEARHIALDRRVALKVMEPALAAQSSAAGRFLREAKAACHIRHQHVVEVFDIGTDHGLPYIVMEFLEGSNLAVLLAEKGPLPVSGIANIFLPVISAVATAHAAGVIHRDLKPANLMLAQCPPRAVHPMVLDFGISKIANDELESTLTRSESLLGTVQYMAPELTKGAKFASAASDQYALGVMLYECATGRRPFTGQSHYDLMHAIVTAPVVPPNAFRPELPPEFDALVAKAMHRDPSKRFPSVHALGGALLSFGGRAAWALWESEFAGTARDVDLWTTDGGTLHDASRGDGAGAAALTARRAAPVRTRLTRTVLAPLAVYAAIVTTLLARRTIETSAVETSREPPAFLPMAESTVGAAPRSIVTGPSDEISAGPNPSTSDERFLTRERLAKDRRSSTSDQTNRSAVQVSEASTRIDLEPAAAPTGSATVQHPVRPAPVARKARPALILRSMPVLTVPAGPDPKTPPALSVHEGTNGAPIVD
jgi:tRNA A-37 threonylcarbamoyl transferase component Bud32